MEGPEIEGPPIWLNLNRQAEEKLLGFCKNNNARLQWLDDYLAEAKAKLGVKCEEPTFVPKVRHSHSNLKTIHLTNFCFPYLFFAIIRGGAAYLYLISILIWPHFDTYPYISIQNILMRAQNILITKIYL